MMSSSDLLICSLCMSYLFISNVYLFTLALTRILLFMHMFTLDLFIQLLYIFIQILICIFSIPMDIYIYAYIGGYVYTGMYIYVSFYCLLLVLAFFVCLFNWNAFCTF